MCMTFLNSYTTQVWHGKQVDENGFFYSRATSVVYTPVPFHLVNTLPFMETFNTNIIFHESLNDQYVILKKDDLLRSSSKITGLKVVQ